MTLPRLSPLAALLLVFGLGACDSTDPFGPPAVGGQLQAEAGRGTAVDLTLSLDSEAGVRSLTVSVDGAAAEPVAVPAGADEVVYTFEVPAEATVGTAYVLLFTITDADGATATATGTVTVGRLIEAPATYAFTRDGASTVSYGGQTERLDQLAAMKRYLSTGDAGAELSEQTLLDMFSNAGGNGGGAFSFTSTKQLRDKTFQPDLDDRLFEDLFAGAAAASRSGATAANGTAGRIVRENSGSTILVDAKGREFTQLIEKGLMGAVFQNQVYNTYLTDARIGAAVENTALVDGTPYTAMEHHWDEAFGYFGAPIDFASDWPSERSGELAFWSKYSNVSDAELRLNGRIMDAYIAGRAAVVNNDRTEIDAQAAALYTLHELTAAATAVHYINDTLGHLNDGKAGEAFHTLSEAWAFVNAVRYTPRRALSLGAIGTILTVDFGADGNFWEVTPAGLNRAKATIVAAYPELAPVQDQL
ncbi:DUF4856 domain-containing protein [Rubrivirga sp. IMCC45206]|uniref:DUF4856 domain-containing protein n=1 Tax=Rubrivirga sp. IMCC45206 TaxID=3391614 RepID=UPI00398FC7D8